MSGWLVSDNFRAELYAMTRWWRQTIQGNPRGRGPEGRVVPFLFRRFMPLAAMAPGESMSVRPAKWDDYDSELKSTTDYGDFTVHDVNRSHRVTAIAAEYADHDDLKIFGWAMHPHDEDRWEIVSMPGQALKIHFSLSGALATMDATGTATVDHFYNGYDPDYTDEGITVHNLPISSDYQYEGDSGDKGAAWYDWKNDKYWIDDMECA